jgi:CheY-like chemotaxis protein
MTASPEAALLLVEDDDADVELTRRAFDLAGFKASVTRARDGHEALERLRAGERFALVVTDIKMPRMTGLDLLAKLRGDPALEATPVVVLTSSTEDRDRLQALKLGALDYLQKPMSFDGWRPVIDALRARLRA